MLTLVGVARAHADVPDITSLDDVVERLHLYLRSVPWMTTRRPGTHSLLDWRSIVEAVAFEAKFQRRRRASTGWDAHCRTSM